MLKSLKRHSRLLICLFLVVLAILTGLWLYLGRGSNPQKFIEVVNGAQPSAFLEGLPHPIDDGAILTTELQTKATRLLHEQHFYQEALVLNANDAAKVAAIVCDPETYQPWRTRKLCGGFHADFALEWRVGGVAYSALICFKCREIILDGPMRYQHYDINEKAYDELKKLLRPYRKNRPPLVYEY